MKTYLYIASQIFGTCGFIISLIAYHRKTKKKILRNMVLSNILNLIHYLLLGAYSGCITKVLAIARDSFIIKKEKNPKLSKSIYLYIFILLYVLASIFTYKGILSLLPLLAAFIYFVYVWNGNEYKIKKVGFLTNFLWLAYNIYILSVVGIITHIISTISTYIALINYKKEKQQLKTI